MRDVLVTDKGKLWMTTYVQYIIKCGPGTQIVLFLVFSYLFPNRLKHCKRDSFSNYETRKIKTNVASSRITTRESFTKALARLSNDR